MLFPSARSVSSSVPARAPSASPRSHVFSVETFLDSAGLSRRLETFRSRSNIFAQGDVASHVLYIQAGGVKVTVINKGGKEAVIAILGPGDFLGEGCLAGQAFRMGTATAITPATLMIIEKQEMIRTLQAEHAFSDRFLAHTLARNIRIEEDLIDQLFNSSEKRLARTLLLLAHYGESRPAEKVVAKISQGTLAEMVGTTRSRVNFFMNKFRKQGFIRYQGGEIQVNNSLLSVVLHD
jgi:CRP/FNR family transcriptional regulator, cyclic AMP receptor protein